MREKTKYSNLRASTDLALVVSDGLMSLLSRKEGAPAEDATASVHETAFPSYLRNLQLVILIPTFKVRSAGATSGTDLLHITWDLVQVSGDAKAGCA